MRIEFSDDLLRIKKKKKFQIADEKNIQFSTNYNNPKAYEFLKCVLLIISYLNIFKK